jgi:hypothetical protein
VRKNNFTAYLAKGIPFAIRCGGVVAASIAGVSTAFFSGLYRPPPQCSSAIGGSAGINTR